MRSNVFRRRRPTSLAADVLCRQTWMRRTRRIDVPLYRGGTMSPLARREAGAAGGPTIVFLHASGTTGAMWDDEMARLADRFHCLAPDLPGHGDSGEHPWR